MSDSRFFNLSFSAPARLAMMRAAGFDNWRKARHWTLANWQAAFCTFSAGEQGPGQQIWYSHVGPTFRDEKLTSDSYWTDAYMDETACGLIARLPHGRFFAGYLWSSNNERVYFPEVFTDEETAEQMASEHARVFAESAFEDSERYRDQSRAESDEETAVEKLRDTWALRHAGRRNSNNVRAAVQSLRNAREKLFDATRAYEKGAA